MNFARKQAIITYLSKKSFELIFQVQQIYKVSYAIITNRNKYNIASNNNVELSFLSIDNKKLIYL